MNKIERIKMVKAMEFIMRQLNDEEVFYTWLEDGADLAYWIDSNVCFADLMDTFLFVIRRACRDGRRGALVCDNVLSGMEEANYE